MKWVSGYDQTLPDSLYLTAKPAFFGSLPWPWVDPNGTTKTYTLPAKARYDGVPPPTGFTLTVAKAGTGSGTVTSSPAGISCGAACSASYTSGTVVTLSQTADHRLDLLRLERSLHRYRLLPGHHGRRQVRHRHLTPSTPSYTLTVAKAGTGSGTVTSSPAGISCGAACCASYTSGTVVTLSQTAAAGSTFAGWSGACPEPAPAMVTMGAAQVRHRHLQPQPRLLHPHRREGRHRQRNRHVESRRHQLRRRLQRGLHLRDRRHPHGRHRPRARRFSGWSGACTGTGSCQVTMTAAQSVTATFTLNSVTYTLTVAKDGTGSGTVTSSPAGINCGADCSEPYTSGTVVTLTAVRGHRVHLRRLERRLLRHRLLPGHHERGAVRHRHLQREPGQLHPDRREGGHRHGNRDLLPGRHQLWHRLLRVLPLRNRRDPHRQPAASGSTFSGWSGACSGTGTCQVTMSAAGPSPPPLRR